MSLAYHNAIIALAPGAQFAVTDSDYNSIIWMSPGIPQPSKAAVDSEVARQTAMAPLEATKGEAKLRIAATDWAVLPDVGLANVDAYVAYRATLRGLITSPVANPSWPTEPQPIWS